MKLEKTTKLIKPEDAVGTVVEFDIPIQIPLPDGEYNVKVKGKPAIINLTTIKREKLPEYTKLSDFKGNFRVENDFRSAFYYSHIFVILPGVFEFGPKDPWTFEYKVSEKILEYINRIIENFRYYSGEFYVENITNADIWGLNFGYINKANKFSFVGLVASFPGTLTNAPRDYSYLDKLRNSLENENQLDRHKLLLLDAKYDILKENYELATLKSVIALEMVLSDFIRREGDKRGIKKGEIKKYINDVGLSGNIKVTLKLLTDTPINNKLISTCGGAIKIRNKIVHGGYIGVTKKETEERLEAIEKLISQIKSI